MALASKTFRIFVSSTFSDLKEERNALQSKVFPRLRELCQGLGCKFQAIDLRWGVREEAALDQQTMRICLEEINRCQRVTPRPNFIVLLGDRYGWRPLPYEIPASEFEEILKNITYASDKNLLIQWYRRDDNAVPPVFCLQLREVKTKNGASEEEQKKAHEEEAGEWREVELKLIRILHSAVGDIPFNEDQRMKYIASATEQEIAAGAMKVDDAQEHVFCFFRKIRNLPEDKDAKEFVDLAENGKIDVEAQTLLNTLKEKLKTKLPNNIFEYEAEWEGNSPSIKHLDKLCEDVRMSLSEVILKEIVKIKEVGPLEKEIDDHVAFMKDRAKFFIGRAEILKIIRDYIKGQDPQPLVIWGDPGSGKSALLAKAIEQARDDHSNAKIVFRFVGVTPASSDGRALLESLCRQVSRYYEVEEANIPTDYNELVKEFPKRLALAKAESPLIVFIDALDQLSDAHGSRNLAWLPSELPGNVPFIISTLPGECKSALERKLPQEKLIELKPMPLAEGEELLEIWLKDAKRALQKEQREEVLSKFKKEGRPLYLKLAFEEARRWKSYTENFELSPTILGIIDQLFTRLSSDANHGEIMVSHSLGYLAAAKNGLSEDELIDILSQDEKVYQNCVERAFHKPPEQRLPVVVWSRLYFDLEPYLTEHSADGTSLMTFYHPTTIGGEVNKKFLSSKEKLECHQKLAHYFEQQPLYIEKDEQKKTNLRKLSELPYQETYAGMWEELDQTLTDFKFLESKNTHFSVFELIGDYRRALAAMPKKDEIVKHRNTIQALVKILDQASFVLKDNPELTFPQIYNLLQWQTDETEFLKRPLDFERRRFKKLWLRLLTSPAQSSALIRTLAGHTAEVTACAFNPDGRRIVSGSEDGTLKLWDAESGKEIATFRGHSDSVFACAFSPDGRRIISGSKDETLKLWDAETGQELRTLKGHRATVYACAFSPDGRRIVSGSRDGTLRLWDAESGRVIYTLQGHTSGINACAFSPDGRRILSDSGFKSLELWDAETGRKLRTLARHYDWIRGCAFSPDGRRIVSGSEDGALKLWDAESGKEIATFKGHTNGVNACAFSPDGRRIISACREKTLKLWDAETGQELGTLTGHSGVVLACAFSPDGGHIVSGSSDGTLNLWDAESGKVIYTLQGHTSGVNACAFSPDGRRIISASEDKTLKLWDGESGKEISTLRGHLLKVNACAFSPDGRRIVSGSDDMTLRLWDGDSGKMISTLKAHIKIDKNGWTKIGYVKACAFSPDGGRIISASVDRLLKLWDAETGQEIRTLKGHTGFVWACAFSPDGRRIISASEDKTLKLWDAESGKKISTLRGHTRFVRACAFSPDGRRIVSGSDDGTLNLWDAESGKKISTLRGHTKTVWACAFSPDGRRIISASEDKTLNLWNGESGEEIYTLKGHTKGVHRCAFSPDGRRIVSGSRDGTLRLWNTESGKVIYTLQGHTNGVNACAFSPDGRRIVLGDDQGQVLLVFIENIEISAPVITPVRIRVFEGNKEKNHWEDTIKTTCQWCGKRFVVGDGILNIIRAISHNANLSSKHSPRMEPPAEAWNEPELISECPHCKKTLRFNPFIVDNRDKYGATDKTTWETLPWWKRFMAKKPEKPKRI